jgi:hypothetical protein
VCTRCVYFCRHRSANYLLVVFSDAVAFFVLDVHRKFLNADRAWLIFTQRRSSQRNVSLCTSNTHSVPAIIKHFLFIFNTCSIFLFVEFSGFSSVCRFEPLLAEQTCLTKELTYCEEHWLGYYLMFSFYSALYTGWSPLWSSGQSSWLQIQMSRVWFSALPDFLRSSGCGTGSTEPREDNWGATWKQSSGSGLENRN